VLYAVGAPCARELHEYRQLKASSVVTRATVLERAVVQTWEDVGYVITYSFGVGELHYANQVAVRRATYDALREGGLVTVVYVPRNPAVSTLQEYFRPPTIGSQLLFIGVGASALLWLLAAFSRELLRRPQRPGGR
jgi:hypothetical protein